MYDESQRAFLYPRFIYLCGFPINSHKRRKDPHSIAVATYVWKKARRNWKIIYRRTYVEGLRSARFSLSCPSARFYRRFAHGSSYPHLYSLSEPCRDLLSRPTNYLIIKFFHPPPLSREKRPEGCTSFGPFTMISLFYGGCVRRPLGIPCKRAMKAISTMASRLHARHVVKINSSAIRLANVLSDRCLRSPSKRTNETRSFCYLLSCSRSFLLKLVY